MLAGMILIVVSVVVLWASFYPGNVTQPAAIAQGPVAEPLVTAGPVAPPAKTAQGGDDSASTDTGHAQFQPRAPGLDTSGSSQAVSHLRWTPTASLAEVAANWRSVVPRMIEELDTALPPIGKSDTHRLLILVSKANVLNMKGETQAAYELLEQSRA